MPRAVRKEADVRSDAPKAAIAASPTHPMQKRRTQPSRVRRGKCTTGKQTKHKKANPNASRPFNHRARFTKFKRRIHAQRRWVLERYAGGRLSHDVGGLEEETTSTAASASGSSFVSEHDAIHEVSDKETLPRGVALSSPPPPPPPTISSATVARTVSEMDALFLELDAAMKQRRFGRAAFLKRCLRARRYQLRRELHSRRPPAAITASTVSQNDASSVNLRMPATSTERVASSTTETSSSPPLPSSTYRSFHPSSTWLGVGRHPRSDWVDQRSGRYPKPCSHEQILFVLRTFADGIPAKDLDIPAEFSYMMPAPPLAGFKPGEESRNETKATPTGFSSRSSPPTRSLTRTQRQQKASLYVAFYCTNVVTDTLDDLCFTLLQGLYKEQRELKQKQPLQFKARQRYVVGFQEVLKCLKAGRVKLVLLAADVESVDVSEVELEEDRVTPAKETSAPSTVQRSKTRKKAFQSLHEAVTQVQQLCGAAKPTTNSAASLPSSPLPAGPTTTNSSASTSSPRTPPLCVTCMSRQRLSYALYAKGSKVACVGVMQAEKNRDVFKAVVAYGRLLTDVYTNEMAGVVQSSE